MKNKFLLIILSLFFVVGIFSFGPTVFESEVVSHQYYEEKEPVALEEDKLEKSNKDLLDRIKKLEDLAETYIKDRGVPANKTELCLQYLRRDRFNDEKWSGLLGPVDGAFVEYVENYGYDLEFSDSEIIYDLGTNRAIDFIHMVATLNSYVRYGDTISLIITDLSTDYAGWAGDSMTFLEEMAKYRIENTPNEDILERESDEAKQQRYDKYLEHVISYLGTNKSSTLSSSDILADIDAYNIHHDDSLKVRESLYDALVMYYQSYEGNSHAGNRFTVLQSKFGATEAAVYDYVRPYMENTVVRKLFIPNTTDKIIEDDIDVFAKAFSKYVMGEIYIDIENYNKDIIVGKEIKLKIIENRLDYANVVVAPDDLAEAVINGEYLVVTPKQAGVAEITVSSLGGSASKIHKIKIYNIKPKIVIGLDSNYYFNETESSTVSVDASGTNNVYTWYMSDLKNGDYKILSETSTPSYAITATKEMDGKYLKCGIKNVGSEEIFTNVAKVHVASSRMEMFLKKNNTTLYIAIALVLLVILIIVFVYFNFIKGKEKDPFKKHWDKVKAKEEEKEAAKQKAAEEALQKQEEERKKNVVVYEVKSMQPTMEEYNQSVNEVQQVQEPVAPMVQQPEHPVVQQPVQQSSLNTIDLFSHVGTEQNNQDSNGTE